LIIHYSETFMVWNTCLEQVLEIG